MHSNDYAFKRFKMINEKGMLVLFDGLKFLNRSDIGLMNFK